MVSKTRKAFVIVLRMQGQKMQNIMGHVFDHRANNTVSRSPRYRIVPANSFMPPPSLSFLSLYCTVRTYRAYLHSLTRLVSVDSLPLYLCTSKLDSAILSSSENRLVMSENSKMKKYYYNNSYCYSDKLLTK